MFIEDFPGNTFGSAHTQTTSTEKVDEAQIDIECCHMSHSDSAHDVDQYVVSPVSCSSQEQSYEHAALQAWCLLMNAYLEDVSTQRKSQLLKEWQNAEQRLTRKNISRELSFEGLN